MKKTIISARSLMAILSIITASLVGGLFLRIAFAWVGAPANPPDNNVAPPLNVGSIAQTKQGNLTIQQGSSLYISTNGRFYDDGTYMRYEGPHSFYVTGNVNRAYIYPSNIYLGPAGGSNVYFRASNLSGDSWSLNSSGDLDVSCITLGTSGQKCDWTDVAGGGESLTQTLAIGNSAGSYDVDMNNNNITNVNKMTVNTIDPVYIIGSEKFATYIAAMTGVKEETTGNVELKCQNSDSECIKVIDFDKQEKGSDLWLFYQVTDFGKDYWDKLVVLLTPEGQNNVWYKLKPQQHQLIIYGRNGGRVSYRLTAPRFDYSKWSNISSEKNVKGIQVVK